METANGGSTAGDDTANCGVGGIGVGGDVNRRGGRGGQGFEGTSNTSGGGGGGSAPAPSGRLCLAAEGQSALGPLEGVVVLEVKAGAH